MDLLAIAAGGAAGALLRFAAGSWALRHWGTAFPWGTLAVNFAGCLAIGALWAWNERAPFPAAVAALVFVGLIGAFTTFSTFGLETIGLLSSGQVPRALAYVAASNGLGLAAAFVGGAVVRLLPHVGGLGR